MRSVTRSSMIWQIFSMNCRRAHWWIIDHRANFALFSVTTPYPENGQDAGPLLAETLTLLKDNQVFNSHPGFMAYITASPAPIGILADLMTSTLNPNLGVHYCGALATEIELQIDRFVVGIIGFRSCWRLDVHCCNPVRSVSWPLEPRKRPGTLALTVFF